MLIVPRAARVACWLNGWLARRESADAVISGVIGADAAVEFAGLTPGVRLSPALLLGELRRQGASRVTASLPTPGDPIGLGGPALFNADALDVGEAIVAHGPDIGFVPRPSGGLTVWMASAVTPPTFLPDIPTADRELRAAVTQAAADLGSLDVASWSPDAADALLNLRAPATLDAWLPFPTPRAAQLAVTSLRCQRIVELALRDEGGSLSATVANRRRTALQPLARAARAGLVAATSSLDGDQAPPL
ncbi:MAG: hypothetical protein ACR2KG_07915 [Nocardioidaceae bacterium]